MDTVVLFNPSSGRGRALRKRSGIARALRRAGIEHDWFVSQDEDHLRELARAFAGRYRFLVVVGGDTTFQIVASQVLESGADAALGLVGAGSNNDIPHGMGINGLKTIRSAIQAGRYRRMDVGRIQIPGRERPVIFLGAASLGLGAEVNQYVADFWRRHPIMSRGGDLIQTLAGLWGIRRSFAEHSVPARVRLTSGEGEPDEVEFSLMVFANVPSFAGKLPLTPHVSPFCGGLDCCLVRSDSFSSTFSVGIKALHGRHLGHPSVEVRRSVSFEVASPVPLDLQYDGELIRGITNFRISVWPQALKVLL